MSQADLEKCEKIGSIPVRIVQSFPLVPDLSKDTDMFVDCHSSTSTRFNDASTLVVDLEQTSCCMDLPIDLKLKETASMPIDTREEDQYDHTQCSAQQESKQIPLSDVIKKYTGITSEEGGDLVGFGDNSYNCLVSSDDPLVMMQCHKDITFH